ncbi:MAG TPA: hypothetical protein VG733_07210 [Chthoniobacteraceae bacterium]|nr:hypothetical protein [Chthoniobacteraceae bacterium]
MVIIYNAPGITMVTVPVVACSVASVYLPGSYLWVLFTGAWGAAMFLGDLTYRATKGGRSWFHHLRGGHLFFIPVWILGAAMLAVYAHMAIARGHWLPFDSRQ